MIWPSPVKWLVLICSRWSGLYYEAEVGRSPETIPSQRYTDVVAGPRGGQADRGREPGSEQVKACLLFFSHLPFSLGHCGFYTVVYNRMQKVFEFLLFLVIAYCNSVDWQFNPNRQQDTVNSSINVHLFILPHLSI